MKLTSKRRAGLISLVLVAMLTAGCSRTNDSASTSPSNNSQASTTQPSDKTSTTTTTTTGSTTPSNSNTASSTNPDDSEKVYSVTEANDLAATLGEDNTVEYVVKGSIKSFANYYYGQITLTDGTNDISVYGLRGLDSEGNDIYFDKLEYVPIVGDTITIKGILHTYKGTPELKTCHIQNIEKTHTAPSQEGYQESTIAATRAAAVTTKVKLTGIVSYHTRTQKMNYNGFYLIDSTGSIFIYGGMTTVQTKIGNKVTVIGEVEHFVASNEQALAQQNGYEGSIQLSNTYLIDNDNQTHDFDKSWIQESTVKKIMETDVKEKNITTDVFKVKAIIKKKEGGSFVNYYVDDLDGYTGSYVYTSNSGSDFSYLDDYLDQVLNVYLSPINCKSTASGCVYRFIPVAVEKIDNYVYDLDEAPQFALDYVAMDQFNTDYAGDPDLEVKTTYSNDLLGIENLSISYASDNESLAYFKTEEGKTTFHVNKVENQTAKITVTASLNGKTATDSITVKYFNPLEGVKTVNEAITAAVDDTIKIRGVISGKVMNQAGFYVVDNTGSIACLVKDSTVLSELNIGDEIVISGTRSERGKDGNMTQIILSSCEIIGTLSTKNNYSTASFETKTVADLAAMKSIEDTAKIYTVSAYLIKTDGSYGQLYLFENEEEFNKGKDGKNYKGTCIRGYSSGTNQFAFVEPFLNTQATVEVAVVNFNGKAFLASVVSVSDGTTKVNNPLH